MSTFAKSFIVALIAVFTLFLGSIQNASAGVMEKPKAAARCHNLPVIKNLTGLKAQHVCEAMLAAKELTKGEVKTLTAIAKSQEDHLTVARYFRAKAEGLDAQAAGYEEAAANLWHASAAKNLVAPTTAGRYSFAAERFRENARADIVLARSHEAMARVMVASVN
jgi:hypothetical protein